MAARGVPRLAGAALVALTLSLLAVQVVRTAAVADRNRHPDWAGVLWPDHPSVLTDKTLLTIASAAAQQKDLPGTVRRDILRIAADAPLSADPYLVEAAVAETRGRDSEAERLLAAARSRDPRSRGTRYLLADRYLRTGRVTAALTEIQVLVGLNAHGGDPFIPMLVAYAKSPGSMPQLKPFFARNPGLESTVLYQLSSDARNTDLVLALAHGRKPEPDWRGPLVEALVRAGQFEKAYSTWLRVSGERPGAPGIFNPTFAKSDAPPPFNWALPEGSEGVAEANGKGGIDVLYYGRARTVLASELLMLPAGRYRLSAIVSNSSGEQPQLQWLLRCAGPDAPLGMLPLGTGNVGTTVQVPETCKAQWLELIGIPGDMPRTTEVTIRNLRLGVLR